MHEMHVASIEVANRPDYAARAALSETYLHVSVGILIVVAKVSMTVGDKMSQKKPLLPELGEYRFRVASAFFRWLAAISEM